MALRYRRHTSMVAQNVEYLAQRGKIILSSLSRPLNRSFHVSTNPLNDKHRKQFGKAINDITPQSSCIR